MEPFFKIFILVAAVVLIIVLTYIGIKMSYASKNNTVYPPNAGTCPDYWTLSSDMSSCVIPAYSTSPASINIGSVYDSSANPGTLLLNPSTTYGLNYAGQTINFNDSGWTASGQSAICAQSSWANTYGVVWDGISNYNSCSPPPA
jgi:hypothetical protein